MIIKGSGRNEELVPYNPKLEREVRRIRRERREQIDMEGQGEQVGIRIEGGDGGVYQHEAPQPNILPQQLVIPHPQNQLPPQYPPQPYAQHFVPQPQYEPPPMLQHNNNHYPQPQQQR